MEIKAQLVLFSNEYGRNSIFAPNKIYEMEKRETWITKMTQQISYSKQQRLKMQRAGWSARL